MLNLPPGSVLQIDPDLSQSQHIKKTKHRFKYFIFFHEKNTCEKKEYEILLINNAIDL